MKKNVKDNRGYNQVWRESRAMKIRTARRLNRIISEMNINRNIDILEIGCGTGEMSYAMAKQLSKSRVLGIDLCTPFIDSAKKKYKLKNLKFEALDFNDDAKTKRLVGSRKFDYVVGNGILHHLYYQLDQSIKQLKGLLKNDGKILFWEPNILNPYCFLIFKIKFFRRMANLEPGELAFSKLHIRKILKSKKFSNIKTIHSDFLLPNTPSFMIGLVSMASDRLDYIPLINKLSQSIFISAVLSKPKNLNN